MTLGFSTHYPKPNHQVGTLFAAKIMRPYSPGIARAMPDLLPKIHTFRLGNRWRAGMTIQMVTGNRTLRRYQFNAGIPELSTCISAQPAQICINVDRYIDIAVGEPYKDQRWLTREELLLFAVNDGFNSLEELTRWFFPKGYTGTYEPLVGQIVHWTSFKY